jgi:GxxExxY protein
MNTEKEFLYKELTGEIIDSACIVHNTLGCGLLEKIYENSLIHELKLRGKQVASQKEFTVVYKEKQAGIYYADLVVDDKVLLK